MTPSSSAQQKTVRLICWNEGDAAARARILRRAGYRVIADPPENAGGMVRYFRELAPDAVVIDLDRLPSHGRELGLSLRASKSTSHLRLVFAGGLPAKIELVRAPPFPMPSALRGTTVSQQRSNVRWLSPNPRA